MTYQPREDSLLLDGFLKQQCLEGKRVLDMGTGSGILAITAAEHGAEVVAADIDPEALKDAEEYAREKGADIEFVKTDLFEEISGSFDLIVFNPPYLQGEDYDALEGGEKGVELTREFLEEADEHLSEEGEIVFIASDRADVETLEEEFELERLERRKLWFETLYLFKSD